MDTLNGNLETFSINDVVHMIAAAESTGVIRVEAGAMTGRVFFIGGEVTFATTRGEDGSIADLLRYSSDRPERERRGRKGRARWTKPLEALVLQQIVEVFVRLQRPEHGRFWFVDGVRTRAYGSDPERHFPIEQILRLADERRAEWREIEEMVPEATTIFTMRPLLSSGLDEITLDGRDWEIISAVSGGATVQELAERLGIFEFPAAQIVAEFIERDLLVDADVEQQIIEEARTVVLSLVPDDSGAAAARIGTEPEIESAVDVETETPGSRGIASHDSDPFTPSS